MEDEAAGKVSGMILASLLNVMKSARFKVTQVVERELYKTD